MKTISNKTRGLRKESAGGGILCGLLEERNMVREAYRDHLGRLKFGPKVSRDYYRVTLNRLKKRGLITEARREAGRESKKFLKLTKKGKVQALLYKLCVPTVPKARAWDGKWRLALFDIPEAGKSERDRIRRTLRLMGFCRLQKSVYLWPYELPEDVIKYLHDSGMNRYLRFARIDRLDDEREFIRKFKVKRTC